MAGTAVAIASGYAAIETLKQGDLVWSWDEETGDVALKAVVQTFVNETRELIHLKMDGEEIITTPTHPFYVYERGWYAAEDLRAGDILVQVNGKHLIVELVQHEILEAPIKVYNFEVEDYHTYYVGDGGILVHNACPTGRANKQKRLRQLANDDKVSSSIRGEIKRDMNQIARGKRTTIRVPQGYNLCHPIGKTARKGYSYSVAYLDTVVNHRMFHRIFGYQGKY